MTFADFYLDEKILRNLKHLGFTKPTPAQSESIPEILNNRDVLASAKTGSGKTAAFIIPVLQKLLNNENEQISFFPKVLILSPTRELANQIKICIQELSRNLNLKYGVIVGGMPYPPQVKLLNKGLDILVATPGRLLDHLNTGNLDLSCLETLILDEADKMLDMGFQKDIHAIARQTPKNRQTLMFSATVNNNVIAEAKCLLSNPSRIEIDNIKEGHDQIQHSIHFTRNINHKKELLNRLLDNDQFELSIIFTATKRFTEVLSKQFKSLGYRCAALHGDMSQAARNRTIELFRKKQIDALFATDIAARGIDIKDIDLVVNFDLPKSPEDYIHRIGRTGRAESSGTAYSLVGNQDRGVLKRIENLLGSPLKVKDIPAPRSEFNMEEDSSHSNSKSKNQAKNCSGYMRSRTRKNNNKNYQENNLILDENTLSYEQDKNNQKKNLVSKNKRAKRVKPQKEYTAEATPFSAKHRQSVSSNKSSNYLSNPLDSGLLHESRALYSQRDSTSYGLEEKPEQKKIIIKHQNNKKTRIEKLRKEENTKNSSSEKSEIKGRISLKPSSKKIQKPSKEE